MSLIERTPSAYGFPLLMRSVLEHGLAQAAGTEIVYAERVRFTYPEFGVRVHRLAAGLARLGIEPGATVGVMDWDSHRYLESFFAIPMMGAVLHTINVRFSPEQILHTINHARDDVLFVNAEFVPLIEGLLDRIETVKTFILIDDTDGAPHSRIPFATDYETLLGTDPVTFPFPDLDENTRATTFYTTGTTGLPKGVYFSHRQLVMHTLGLRAAFDNPTHGGFSVADVYMPITPMFHVHAWGFPLLATMMGAQQIYPGRYAPEKLLALIKRERVTFSHCVPMILHMLLGHPKVNETDLTRWKVIIGGSAMPQALCRQALEHGIDAYSAYGMSETCPVLTAAHLRPHMLDWDLDRQIEVRCRTGRALPFVTLRIVDENMAPLPHDGKTVGEVVVRSPWLTQGYLNDPGGSETLWRGGWLHTGDIGSIDPDGYLKITDRIKDVIKLGGEWVSSLELEDIIERHPAVAGAAVVGIADPKWGERPVATVVLRPGHEPAATELALRHHLKDFADRGLMSRYAIPTRFVFAKELPRTSVGKLDKKELRIRYQE